MVTSNQDILVNLMAVEGFPISVFFALQQVLSGTLLATPSLKAANAQGNQSAGMNQTYGTQGLPVDTWIKVLKDKNPALANIEQSPDVKDAIGKIKAMKDPREAR